MAHLIDCLEVEKNKARAAAAASSDAAEPKKPSVPVAPPPPPTPSPPPSPAPSRPKRKRPTDIGWDTSDDDDLPLNRARALKPASCSAARRTDKSDKKQHAPSTTRSKPSAEYGARRESPPLPPPPRNRGPRPGAGSSTYDPFRGLALSADASRTKMLLRKRALVLGKFTVIRRSDGKTLGERDDFLSYAGDVKSKPLTYCPCPEGFSKSNYPRTVYAKLKVNFPGVGERHHVAWSAPNGDVHVDRGVKVYDIRSIHEYEIEEMAASPSSPWFALIDPREVSTFDDKVHFDANMFWTVATLFKYFGTSGVEQWDREIDLLKQTHQLAETNVGMPTSMQSKNWESHFAVHRSLSAPLLPTNFISPPKTLVKFPSAPPATCVDQNANSAVIGGRYSGCIVDWKGDHGVISCTLIAGKIVVYPSQLLEGISSSSPVVGTSVSFTLWHGAGHGHWYEAGEVKAFA